MIRRTTATLFLTFALGLGGRAEAAPVSINACGSVAAGSYILTANLAAVGDCLVVGADFVTIDLDGYTISGNGTGRGITDGGDVRLGIAVRGGTVQNFLTGIDLRKTTAVVVEEMRVVGNTERGMIVGGNSLVRFNVANGNGTTGIFIGFFVSGSNSVVTGNAASQNGVNGIDVYGTNGTVTGNTASQNTFDGVTVVGGSTNSTISNNTASENGRYGFQVDSCPSNFVANTALGNGTQNVKTFLAGCQFVDNLN
jgi:parallel beta-helix repeat protein